jgi:hypothetical protein
MTAIETTFHQLDYGSGSIRSRDRQHDSYGRPRGANQDNYYGDCAGCHDHYESKSRIAQGRPHR